MYEVPAADDFLFLPFKSFLRWASPSFLQALSAKYSHDHYTIIEHTATVNGETVFEASVSQFLSKNPIFKYQFKGIGAKGDKVEMSWVDRKGKTSKGKIK